MKLISCDKCAVIIDSDKVELPDDYCDDDGGVDDTKAVWVDRMYKPFIPCPCCGERIVMEACCGI